MEDLGFEGLARDVNQAGQAILSGRGSAFLWQAGGTTPLALTQADAINNLGRVAGVSGGEVAVWENGVTTGLGVPNALYAGINDSGDVVAGHFLWHGDSLYDINTLIEPGGDWTIVYSYGINNRGDIVGQATDGSKYRAVLLTPGPVVVTRPAGSQTVPYTWWPIENQRCNPICFNSPSEKFAGAKNMFLSNILIKSSGTHTVCERGVNIFFSKETHVLCLLI